MEASYLTQPGTTSIFITFNIPPLETRVKTFALCSLSPPSLCSIDYVESSSMQRCFALQIFRNDDSKQLSTFISVQARASYIARFLTGFKQYRYVDSVEEFIKEMDLHLIVREHGDYWLEENVIFKGKHCDLLFHVKNDRLIGCTFPPGRFPASHAKKPHICLRNMKHEVQVLNELPPMLANRLVEDANWTAEEIDKTEKQLFPEEFALLGLRPTGHLYYPDVGVIIIKDALGVIFRKAVKQLFIPPLFQDGLKRHTQHMETFFHLINNHMFPVDAIPQPLYTYFYSQKMTHVHLLKFEVDHSFSSVYLTAELFEIANKTLEATHQLIYPFDIANS